MADFQAKYWEQKPVHIPATAERKALVKGLVSFESVVKHVRGICNSFARNPPFRFR